MIPLISSMMRRQSDWFNRMRQSDRFNRRSHFKLPHLPLTTVLPDELHSQCNQFGLAFDIEYTFLNADLEF
jgi:hypothetical protein